MPLSSTRYHGLVLAAWLALACSSTHQTVVPKASVATPSSAESAEPIWSRWQEVMAWPSSTTTPVMQGGHGNGPYAAEVRVGPAARDLYMNLTAQSSLPADTLVLQVQRDKRGDVRDVFMMEKNSGDPASPSWISPGWSFMELTPRGRVKANGPWQGCARCHAEALADSLFGPARAP